jgi:hypothetical protein
MSALAGNEPGYEEAARALYAGDQVRFNASMVAWPADVRGYACNLRPPRSTKALRSLGPVKK